MKKRLCLTAFALCLSSAAAAAPLTVRVTDAAGRPVSGAVVTVRPSGQSRPLRVAPRYVVSQKDLKFHPFVTVVPVGATVSFPNFDPTKHHVYSFSTAKKFELKLFAREQSRSVRFDKPGVVALGCNIHDAMTAFIVVADSAWTTTTDARGVTRFADVPNARGSFTVWHPYLRAPGNILSKPLVSGHATETVAIRLRPAPLQMSHY